FLANTFLSPKKKPPEREDESLSPGGAAARLADLRELIDQQERSYAALREQLDEMEKLIDTQ
nr:hypothetical protein [Promineifilum sp.]